MFLIPFILLIASIFSYFYEVVIHHSHLHLLPSYELAADIWQSTQPADLCYFCRQALPPLLHLFCKYFSCIVLLIHICVQYLGYYTNFLKPNSMFSIKHPSLASKGWLGSCRRARIYHSKIFVLNFIYFMIYSLTGSNPAPISKYESIYNGSLPQYPCPLHASNGNGLQSLLLF